MRQGVGVIKGSDKENVDNLDFYAAVRSSDMDVHTAM